MKWTPARIASALARRTRWPGDWLGFRRQRLALSPTVAPPPVLPPFGLFRDIAVVSQPLPYYVRRPGDAFSMICGPVFPPEGVEPWMRHCVNDQVFDVTPDQPTGPLKVIETPAVWLGYLNPHFGHLIAEHLTRALWSRTVRPADLYLYVAPPRIGLGWPNYHMVDVLSWYGIPTRQMRRVVDPVMVKELRVFPQSELFLGAGPSAEYLDLLDRHVALADLRPQPSDLLFVTRAGMLARANGGLAGEGYLRDVLVGLGVSVLDPATASLRDQLTAYSGAKSIVFSEGSAVHGRQLLGRLDQKITVLNRRPGGRTAETILRPRCRQLFFAETSRREIRPDTRPEPIHGDALAFFDLPVLFDTFAGLGVDLAAEWDACAYAAAVQADVTDWLAALARTDRGYDVRLVSDAVGAAMITALGQQR